MTAGGSLALVWLSEEELEEVDDRRDFASRPSRTCRKSPLLMTPSFLLGPCAEMEHMVRAGVESLALILPGFYTWQW